MTALNTRQTASVITSRSGSARHSRFADLIAEADLAKLRQAVERITHSQAYSVLAFPVLVALAGLVLFIPTTLLGRHLRAEVENKSIVLGHQVTSLLESTAPVPLARQQEYLECYQQDVEQIERLVQQTTQRSLLDYHIFPEPSSSSIFLFEQFGQRYCSGIGRLLNEARAGYPPSEDEIEAAMRQMPGLQRRNDSHRLAYNRMEQAVVDAVCLDRAKSLAFYASVSDLAGYAFWQDYSYAGLEEAVKDCWYWQLGYWIVEDVIKTIADLNADAEHVLMAPVKRLVGLSFGHERRARRNFDTDQRPKYVTSLKETLTVPLTGRVCDDNVDVVDFKVEAIVSRDAVLPFMKELCSAKTHTFRGFDGTGPERTFEHNQITILESTIGPVERGYQEHRRYCYGNSAVVKLELICEYIFDRKGYEAIKPESVEADLAGIKQ